MRGFQHIHHKLAIKAKRQRQREQSSNKSTQIRTKQSNKPTPSTPIKTKPSKKSTTIRGKPSNKPAPMKTKPSKKPKDPNAPKKYRSAYFIWSCARRPILQKIHADKPSTWVTTLLSSEWKENALRHKFFKQKWQKQAEQEKERYLIQLHYYKKTDKYKEYQQKLKKWEEEKDSYDVTPTCTRIKLTKSFNQMSVYELKNEINKRDTNRLDTLNTNMKKPELKAILFEQIKLSPAEINKLKKKDIIDEIEIFDEPPERYSWVNKDLRDYLKYIYSNPQIAVVDNINEYINTDIGLIENKY
eukprot:38492_1